MDIIEAKILRPEDILLVDMGLINRCNLRCPVCPHTTKKIYEQPKKYVNIKNYINFLDKLINLEVCIIEGNYCEPTLYPHLPELISYLKTRNIRLRLSTNGNARNINYWRELGKLFDENDIIRFDVDGSTNEIHSKYRINGNLTTVLNHHKALKETTKGKTVLQNIIFHYNVDDKENIKRIMKEQNFDYISFIKCYTHDVENSYFRPIDEINKFNIISKKIIATSKKISVLCDAYARKEIYVNHNGKVFLCGSLDEGSDDFNNLSIIDNIDDVFKQLSQTANNIYNMSTCRGDCNNYCYSLGERFPDITINKQGLSTNVNYFTKELYNEQGNILHRLV